MSPTTNAWSSFSTHLRVTHKAGSHPSDFSFRGSEGDDATNIQIKQDNIPVLRSGGVQPRTEFPTYNKAWTKTVPPLAHCSDAYGRPCHVAACTHALAVLRTASSLGRHHTVSQAVILH